MAPDSFVLIFEILLLLMLFTPQVSAAVGGYQDYNGFRYQLANTAVDVDVLDFNGDDCAAFPCANFAVPPSCSTSFPTSNLAFVAQLKQWGTSFLAASDGLYPVGGLSFAAQTIAIVDSASVPGAVSLSDAGWSARIVLRCKMPCAAGSEVVGSTCTPCGVGKWSAEGDAGCQACTNAPSQSSYTTSGAGDSNCGFACAANMYVHPMPSAFLVVLDTNNAIRLVDGGTGTVSTLYRPKTWEPTYSMTYMTPSSTFFPWVVYAGSSSIQRVSLLNGTFTTIAGTTNTGSQDGVGTAASFNRLVAVLPWLNETVLLALDFTNCNVRRVNLTSRAVTSVLGNSACGYQDGQGLGAYFRNPMDMVINAAQTTAYIADFGNSRVRTVVLATMTTTTLVGTGVGGNLDGVGTVSGYLDPRCLALSSGDQSVLYIKGAGPVRRVLIATGQLTTVPSTSLGQSPYQLAVSALNANVVYGAMAYAVAALLVGSGQVKVLAGGSIASTADGKGALAGFIAPSRMYVVNETLTGGGVMCAMCTACPAGQYGVCNSTASFCLDCPLGQYTAAAGSTVCAACPVGTYGAAGGLCATCPAGSVSAAGGVCVNCSAGTYLPSPTATACTNCTGGTFSTPGSTACAQCAALAVGNATYVGAAPGMVNATSCPFVCRAGFNLVQASQTCTQCGVGQFSSSGSTSCAACAFVPANATYVGVGTNATNCPFACNAGFYPTAGICAPCAAGTRQLGTVCTQCLPGAYSDVGSVACAVCGAGRYSTGGASTCAGCANQGAYTQFVGRGTSPSCPFYCVPGSYVLNRTICTPCANGTFASAVGVTACAPCAIGTWSRLAATACFACSSLQITATTGGVQDYPYLAKAGWGIAAVVCVP